LTEGDIPTLTPEGIRRRAAIEVKTDQADAAGYPSLGADKEQRLMELAEPITHALDAAGLKNLPG
jgi:hypothetical protein